MSLTPHIVSLILQITDGREVDGGVEMNDSIGTLTTLLEREIQSGSV